MNIKLRKGQKCWKCKKVIKGEWAYNGHYWCTKCKDKDTTKRIEKYMKPMTLKADKDKITFGFDKPWEEYFDDIWGGYDPFEDTEGLNYNIKQFISTLLKEQEKKLLDRFEKANKGICNIGKKL